jgi:hypothetical protein
VRRRKLAPQITQNTQMSAVVHRPRDDALDLQARPADVEQQAEMQTCGRQIIQALRAMNVGDRLGYSVQHGEPGLASLGSGSKAFS